MVSPLLVALWLATGPYPGKPVAALLEEADRRLAAGEIAKAAELAGEASALAAQSGQRGLQARAENLLGGARLYAGEYDEAERRYRAALALFQALGETKLQIDVLNNLGSVWFFRARYAEAWDAYDKAEFALRGRSGEGWYAEARQLTEVNRAALLQKLGRHEEALALYQQIRQRPDGLSGTERARMLGNYGALLRRLGDPVKAAAVYREALALQPDLDTALGIRKNLGIALAYDLERPREAATELSLVAGQAARAGNAREALQARLYEAEALRRSGAKPDVTPVVEEARRRGWPDELWKALLVQARVEGSAARYEQAVSAVEQMRPGRRSQAPRLSFLQDRAEPYDGRIALLRAERAGADQLLFWQERLRARVLEESSEGAPPDTRLASRVRSRLRPGEALCSIRIARGQGSLVWLEPERERVEWFAPPGLAEVAACWSELRGARESGACAAVRRALPVVAPGRRVYLVSDGPLALFPFEVFWGAGVEVVHLPAARGLLREEPPAPWVLPWTRTAAALAPSLPERRLPGDDHWQPLPYAGREAEDLAQRLPGRTWAATGAAADRQALLSRLRDSLIVHVAAHAAADSEDPSRARLLLADGYLAPNGLQGVRFPGLRLIALSACESALGPQVDGEGLQNWARLFLLQGARAAVGTVWKVEDEAAFLLMQRFYRGVGAGMPAARALAEAKAELAGSRRWSHPRHWAGFVLVGSGEAVLRHIPWWWAMAAFAALAGLMAVLTVWHRARSGS